MIVVDAAAVVDALTRPEGADPVVELMLGNDLHAPGLLDYEVVSALRGLVRGKHLTAARAEDALTDFSDLSVTRWPSGDGLRRRVLQLRDVVSAYDAAYVVLAEALECPLLTRDARLARAVAGLVPVPLA